MPPPPPERDVPDAVRRLLIDHVDGFEELELLIRLARDPAKTWTEDDAQATLGMHDDAIETAFKSLTKEKLVVADPTQRRAYRYGPATPELRDACAQLVALYDEDRFRIVALLGQLAFERIHRATAKAFADAFRIRKKGDDDA